MGLFDLFKPKVKPSIQEKKYAAQIIAEACFGGDEYSYDDAQAEKERQLQEEGKEIRKQRIADSGVNVDVFTNQKAKRDAIELLDAFAPAYSKLEVDVSKSHTSIDFKNLTKTGKVPKNVCVASILAEKRDWNAGKHDAVIGSISYLANGSVNLADFNFWKNRVRCGVSIRQSGDGYAITSIVKYDLSRDLLDNIYNVKTSDADCNPKRLLDTTLKRMLS